ncbi:MAG TPA: DUF1127 domain-containing protein [Burkholderiales bacterium]|nr:DUF1127 domain-containing protein [Burkholderiales bacterium]
MQAPSSTSRPGTRRPFDYRFEAALRRAAWAWLGARIVSAVAAVAVRHRARRTIRELGILSDRELRDIGLCRAEIEEVAAGSSGAR